MLLLSAQLSPTFCDPMDCSTPGSSVTQYSERGKGGQMLDWFFPFSTSSEDFTLVPGYSPCLPAVAVGAWLVLRSLGGL